MGTAWTKRAPCRVRNEAWNAIWNTAPSLLSTALPVGILLKMDSDDILPQLRDARTKLECYVEDMCDFEFTVQEGKLYVLNARRGSRTPIAALRIATDLFLERRITGKELVKRVAPHHVEKLLQPTISSHAKLRVLGTGQPASAGAASGTAALSSDSAIALRSSGKVPILLGREFVPDDIHGMEVSAGIVSFVGGMTGHAAVVARGMGLPCVAGTGWSFKGRTACQHPPARFLRGTL